jgi:hypothetical protein
MLGLLGIKLINLKIKNYEKLSLIALAILTSLSFFAKVNKEVKPEKKTIIYQTFN